MRVGSEVGLEVGELEEEGGVGLGLGGAGAAAAAGAGGNCDAGADEVPRDGEERRRFCAVKRWDMRSSWLRVDTIDRMQGVSGLKGVIVAWTWSW